MTLPLTSDDAYEVYAHDMYADIYDEDEATLYVVAGKDWDEAPFKIFMTKEEASSLIVQLGYQVYERNDDGRDT